MLQGSASPLWPTCSSVYASRFSFDGIRLPAPPPSGLYTISYTRATLDTGGWLDLPDRDFHPARSAKLLLAHIKVEQPVT